MDVASRLAQHRSDLPVLFISGHPKEELVNRGLLNSDTGLFQRIDFLQKPFSIAALECACSNSSAALIRLPAESRETLCDLKSKLEPA